VTLLRQHPSASTEVAEAAAWYDDRKPGLGDDFLDEMERSLAVIAEAPSRWPRVGGLVEEVRRVQLHGFPYAVIYRVGARDVLILAVAHMRRRPGYWRRRLGKR
jgi:plasmid stabilization system protein ParE